MNATAATAARLSKLTASMRRQSPARHIRYTRV
jgi:hypothetical protein